MPKSTTFLLILIFTCGLSAYTQDIPCGDVNTDGSIDIVDALVLAQYYVGLNPSPYTPCPGDVNSDGATDIIDALLIAQYYVGLSTQLPGCPVPCVSAQTTVILAIDPLVEQGIRVALDQFEMDLQAAGYQPLEHIITETTPAELRNYLYTTYQNTTPQPEGLILIGDVPRPYYRIHYPEDTSTIPPCYERGPQEAISYQYYQDLDGSFTLVNPQEAVHEHCYDTHTGEIFSEIWVSALPFYIDTPTTIAGINGYFTKNHQYRTGTRRSQPGYLRPVLGSRINTQELYASQINIIINSANAWQPLTSRGNVLITADNTLADQENFPNAAYSYETAMFTNLYDFANIGAHGSCIAFFAPGGSIRVDVAWAQSHAITPNFLWDSSCNTSNLDCQPNLQTAFLYNADNNVVLIKGATQPQGGLGNNSNGNYRPNIGSALAAGQNFGLAIIGHFNTDLIGCYGRQREFFLSQHILLGDGTLKLQEYM